MDKLVKYYVENMTEFQSEPQYNNYHPSLLVREISLTKNIAWGKARRIWNESRQLSTNKRVLPYVPHEDRMTLQEGVDGKWM